jgi:hypothetical protein
MAAGWWNEVPELLEGAFQHRQGRTRTSTYRFGLGVFELDSDDEGLNRRFGELYPEGAVGGQPGGDGPRVRCEVRSLDHPAVAAIRFEDPEALDPVDFCRTLFPDRNYVAGPEGHGGWRTIALGDRPADPLIAMRDGEAMADRRLAWQPLVANIGLNRLLRLQREVLFFHAASACIGTEGVMLVGPKKAGKTTLSLALASRGNGFLGDEIAAVKLDDTTLLPFRRAAAIRKGIRGDRVGERLAAGDYRTEVFPDGGERVLANVADLFPGAGAPRAPLKRVFFLGGFSPRPRALPFVFGREHFGLLTPLGSSLWGVPSGLRMLQVSRVMARARCYHLEAGMPDETAGLLESLCKESPN